MKRKAGRAAAVSGGYLAAVRDALRVATGDFDGEICALIRAAREDLTLCGVLPSRARDEDDPLILRAVTVYARAEFGLDNPDADRYRAAYERLKTSLGIASEYITPEGG